MAARICMQLFCMKLCFTSRKQSQIDDFQKGTGQILKFINLALFDRLRVAKSNMSPATSCYDYPIVVKCLTMHALAAEPAPPPGRSRGADGARARAGAGR